MGILGRFKQAVKGGGPVKTVFDVKRESLSSLTGAAGHENRTMGDLSHIDFERTHLNEAEGYEGLSSPKEAALKYIEDKKMKIDKRNVTPVTSFVLSASREYFEMGKDGTANPEKLEAWAKANRKWVKDNFGDDCVHMSLHLDEKTPHFHVKTVLSYEKVIKKTGRKCIQASHHQHEMFKGRNSYEKALDSYAEAMAPLGIERGQKLPEGARGTQTTKRQWLASTARKWANRGKVIEQLDKKGERLKQWDGLLLIEEKRQSKKEQDLADREQALETGEQALAEQARAVRADAKRARTPVSLPTVKASEKVAVPPVQETKRPEKRARRKKKTVPSLDD